MATTDPYTRLLTLMDKAETQMQKAFIQAVINAKISIGTLEEIEQLMLDGQLDEAMSIVMQASSDILVNAQIETFIAAGIAGSKVISEAVEVVIGFDRVNDRAVKAIRENRLELIRNFTEEQIKVTRQALIEGTERGLNPREQARHFRKSIGLTAKQQQAVHNYRKHLENMSYEALNRELRDKRFDRTVERSIETKEPLSKAQINKMVDRYRDRYIKYRSEVIARTEALRGVHQGTEEAYAQAIDQGVLDPNKLIRKWIAARDERTRVSHRKLNGDTAHFGEVFHGFNGDLRYPGDPLAPGSETIQCRCSLTTRFL